LERSELSKPWNHVQTQQDVDDLLLTFNDFHDSLLRECKYCAGAYIDDALFLNFNSRPYLRCVFQRQRSEPCAIEVVFSDVDFFQMQAGSEDVISEAFITLGEEGMVVWSDVSNVEQYHEFLPTVIRAKFMSWRTMDEWIGIRERYTAVTPDDIHYYDPEPTSMVPSYSRAPGEPLNTGGKGSECA